MEGILALLIPIFALCIPIVALWTKHQQKLAEMQMDHKASGNEEAAAYTRELEDRLRVLERIVTDKGYDVASQIEALRDVRKTEALLDKREKELR